MEQEYTKWNEKEKNSVESERKGEIWKWTYGCGEERGSFVPRSRSGARVSGFRYGWFLRYTLGGFANLHPPKYGEFHSPIISLHVNKENFSKLGFVFVSHLKVGRAGDDRAFVPLDWGSVHLARLRWSFGTSSDQGGNSTLSPRPDLSPGFNI